MRRARRKALDSLNRHTKRITVFASFLLAVFLLSGCSWLPLAPFAGGGGPDGATGGSATGGSGIAAGGSATAQPADGSAAAVTIKDLKTCREQKDRKCPSSIDVFSADDPRISATATVTNVTVGMQAQITWRFLGSATVDPFVVAESTVTVEEAGASRPLVSTIERKSPDALWAKGLYVVEISIQAGGEQKAWKQFRVE